MTCGSPYGDVCCQLDFPHPGRRHRHETSFKTGMHPHTLCVTWRNEEDEP